MHLFILLFTGLVFLVENYYCARMLKIIPGVPTLHYIDTHYVDDVVFTTRRHTRKSDYIVNLEFTSQVPLGNNVSISLICYQYLHNEYRRSFVEFHFKLCTFILKDAIFAPVFKKVGLNVCPVPPARYRLLNITFDQEFPSVFPFEKGKGELLVKLEPSGKLIAKGDLVMTFKQRIV